MPGLDWVGRLLGAHGRVLPMAAVPLDLVAEVEGAEPGRPDEITTVRGQVACATTPGRVRSISLVPADPPACPEATEAVRAADLVVLGPGSWFTSVLPHLMVPQLAEALHQTPARRLVALNLAPQAGETEGFSPQRTWRYSRITHRSCGSTWCWPTAGRGGHGRMSLRRRPPGWAAAWCWPTWPWGTGHRAMTRSGWQAHSCTSSRGSDTPMAMTSR